mmetsp:Transcript_36069/g.84438  ORF Transcript_36069/g.84438 Transcript_36069/m.84438 type:complete len:213 (-) Transcript_36069:184-822(-)
MLHRQPHSHPPVLLEVELGRGDVLHRVQDHVLLVGSKEPCHRVAVELVRVVDRPPEEHGGKGGRGVEDFEVVRHQCNPEVPRAHHQPSPQRLDVHLRGRLSCCCRRPVLPRPLGGWGGGGVCLEHAAHFLCRVAQRLVHAPGPVHGGEEVLQLLDELVGHPAPAALLHHVSVLALVRRLTAGRLRNLLHTFLLLGRGPLAHAPRRCHFFASL